MLERAHKQLSSLLGRAATADGAATADDELLAEKTLLAKLNALGDQVIALLEGHQADCDLVRKQCADSRSQLDALGYPLGFQLLTAGLISYSD